MILLLDLWVLCLFWVGYSGSVILLLLSALLSVTSSSKPVPSSVRLLMISCTSFGAVSLKFGLLDNSNCLSFGNWGVTECSWRSYLGVSSNSSSSLSDASLGFNKSLWSCSVASFLIADVNLFWGFTFIRQIFVASSTVCNI